VYVFTLVILGMSIPEASAHVKWFVPYDIGKPPLPIDQVLTETFIYFFVGSVSLIYAFFVLDRYIYKKDFGGALDRKLQRHDDFSIHMIRFCASVFFISLWVYYLTSHVSVFLTPELRTNQTWISWVQLAMGFCAMSRRTLPLTGVGIIALYAGAISVYGTFHLLDYVIFLGIAYFLLVTSSDNRKIRKSGFVVLYLATGVTLLWASIEKFGYPHWTHPLLKSDPRLSLGFSPAVFTVLTGFVEFNVTFLLLGATSILTRLIALGLDAVFVMAIYMFGPIDGVGHLMIIAILIVLAVRGPTDARKMVVLNEKSVWVQAYFMTGLYCLALTTFFLLYYGLHYVAYGI